MKRGGMSLRLTQNGLWLDLLGGHLSIFHDYFQSQATRAAEPEMLDSVAGLAARSRDAPLDAENPAFVEVVKWCFTGRIQAME